ncbi:glycosyltransferase, partial [Streptococcus pyogenes]
MIKVAVAMSTYNGEKYLKEQLDSLFEQKKVDLTLFVRDDLSTDKTVEILSQYNGKLIRVDNNSTNLGVGCSFMETLYRVGTDFDYFAFCDQDD